MNKLSHTQQKALEIARGLSQLGLSFARVPQEYQNCFLASDLMDHGFRVTTVRALIRKGRLVPVAIADTNTGQDVVLHLAAG